MRLPEQVKQQNLCQPTQQLPLSCTPMRHQSCITLNWITEVSAGSSILRPIRACLDPNKDTPAANNPKKIALVIQTTRNAAVLAFVTAFSPIIQSTAIACTSTKNFGFKSRGTYSSVFGG
jgi:hypothetical protein